MGVETYASAAAAVFAAAACGFVAWRRRGRGRLAWILLGLSGLTWVVATVARIVVGTEQLAASFPSLQDVQFAAAISPAIIALGLLPGAPGLVSGRLRTLLDGSIVAASLVFVSWGTGLRFAYVNATGPVNQRLSALAHPFGDLVLMVMVIFVLYSGARTARVSRMLLGLGLLAIGLSDSATNWMQLQEMTSELNGVVTWGWALGFALVGLAAIIDWRELRSAPRTHSLVAAAAILYLPMVGAATQAVVRQLNGEGLEPFLFWNGLAIAALVAVREMVTLAANRWLSRSFDARLAARTSELSSSEGRFRTLVQKLSSAFILLDSRGLITYESQSVERVLGRNPGANTGRFWLELMHPDDQPRLQSVLEKSRQAPDAHITAEARVSHGDEGWRDAELTITNQLEEPTVKGFVLNIRDSTERKALEDQLAHSTLHDPLTGLANRALFRDRLHQSVMRAARRREQPAILLLDIDGMKRINESLGRTAGDDVLGAVGERLRQCVRAGDSVGRLGDDEFAVILEDTQDEESPGQVAQRILGEVGRIRIGEPPAALSAGIGIATLEPGSQNPDELLRHADTALSEAKAAGTGKIAVYDRSTASSAAGQRELEADLQQAIERKEFRIHYQPIVRLADGRPTAVEALVRWQHPWRGLLLPGDFIVAADKTGAIVSMGRWVMMEAARQVRRWQQELQVATLGLAVNLSIRQLTDEGLANDISHVIAETGLEPSLLMLEATERVLLEDLEQSANALNRLKGLGANLAVDDCRTGQESLGYLRQLPVDTIKIDRSFVMNIGKQRERTQVESIIKTGASLKLELVAEGIEEAGQATELLAMGCELGQGFYFSKPLAGPQMFDYLDQQWRQKAA